MLDMSTCIKWWDKTAFFIQLETNFKTVRKNYFQIIILIKLFNADRVSEVGFYIDKVLHAWIYKENKT